MRYRGSACCLQLHPDNRPQLVRRERVHAACVRAHLVGLLEAVVAHGAQVAVAPPGVRVVLVDLQELARLEPLRAHVALRSRRPETTTSDCRDSWYSVVETKRFS